MRAIIPNLSTVALLSILSLAACDSSTPNANSFEPGWNDIGLIDSDLQGVVYKDLFVYAFSKQEIWRTVLQKTDSHWESVAEGLSRRVNADFNVHDIVSSGSDSLLVTVRTNSPSQRVLYRSINGGLSWMHADSSLWSIFDGDTTFFQVRTLISSNNRVVADGYASTINMGESWTRMVQITGTGNRVSATNPTNDSIIWQGGLSATTEPALGFTIDGGWTWMLRSDNIRGVAQGQTVTGIVPFAAQDSVVVATSAGLFFSDDAAVSWTELGQPNGTCYYEDLAGEAVVKPVRMWVLCRSIDNSMYLFQTSDMGENWHLLEPPNNEVVRAFEWVSQEQLLVVVTNERAWVIK